MGLIEQIEAALTDVDPFAPDTPNLNAWPQPNVRREFAEWLAARIDPDREAVSALEEARALIETAEKDGYVSAGWREDARSWAMTWADAFGG
jgi:hypothetical protein